MIILKIFIALLFLVTIIFFVFEGIKYTRMIARIFMGLVYEPDLPKKIEARGKAVVILDSSASSIHALYEEVPGSNKVVIFCHESGSGKESWNRYAFFLPELGYSVLSFDFDIESLSQWPTDMHVRKLVTVIRWLKQLCGSELQLVLFGVSNGADIALSASQSETCVKAVVADGLFSMKEIFRDYIRKWAPVLVKPNFFGEHYPDWVVNLFTGLGFNYSQKKARTGFVDTERLLQGYKKPLCMIYGSEDNYVLPTHQKLLLGLCSKNKDFVSLTIKNAGHNKAVLVAEDEYKLHVGAFLKKVYEN